MSEVSGKLPKPKMRSLLHSQIKRNLAMSAVGVIIAGVYMRFVFGDGRKKVYAEFYKTYDAEKEFHRMRKKGVFDSCDADDDD